MTRAVASAGFTLIEMLVVLAIIGIVAGLTVMGLARPSDNAEREAHLLARRIGIAADRALVTDRAAVMRWDSRGYEIVEDGAKDADRHDLPASAALSATGERKAVLIAADAPPFALRLGDGAAAWTVAFGGLDAKAMAAR